MTIIKDFFYQTYFFSFSNENYLQKTKASIFNIIKGKNNSIVKEETYLKAMKSFYESMLITDGERLIKIQNIEGYLCFFSSLSNFRMHVCVIKRKCIEDHFL